MSDRAENSCRPRKQRLSRVLSTSSTKSTFLSLRHFHQSQTDITDRSYLSLFSVFSIMSRHFSRSLLRRSCINPRLSRAPQFRRFLSNAPPASRSRSWKSSAARWGLAGGAIYYYNTSPYFANEPLRAFCSAFHHA